MDTKVMMKKERESNMELLRIISMLMVLAIHADFYEISSSWVRWPIILTNDAGVNCFVLISGYFGIHAKWKGFLSLMFVCLFYLALSYIFQLLFREVTFSFKETWNALLFIRHSWFVRAYIALYVFSPVLNMFVKHTTRRSLGQFLVLWYIATFTMGYIVDYMHTERGYSFLSFIFLYMLAAYVRKYEVGRKIPHLYFLFVFVLISIGSGMLLAFFEMKGKGIGGEYYLRAYNSPLMIMASIALLMYFSRLRIRSKKINRIAGSSFAVYIMHSSDFFYQKYRHFCNLLFLEHSQIVAFGYTLITILLVYAITLCVDQIRLEGWNVFYSLLSKKTNEAVDNNYKL